MTGSWKWDLKFSVAVKKSPHAAGLDRFILNKQQTTIEGEGHCCGALQGFSNDWSLLMEERRAAAARA